ncbi:MAG: hypothetical protein AAGE76_07680 [Pseudomonadota bacterium]
MRERNRLHRLLAWTIVFLAALGLPIYALGFEWRLTDTCAPDLPAAVFAETRRVALMTWAGTLVGVGAGIRVPLSLIGVSGGIVWWAFGLWKALSLGLALIVTPGCFEGYSFLADRAHPLEAPLGLLTLASWLLLLVAITLRAATAGARPTQPTRP